MVAHIAGFQATYPGHTIDPASGVDDNGDGLRFGWVMRNGDEVVLEGMDFAELAPDGRIGRIVGFFGPFRRSANDRLAGRPAALDRFS